jgi:nitrite reductase (NADH) large subunit
MMSATERRTPRKAAKPRVVIVGNGMVGHRLCERLAADGAFTLTCVGEERRPAYDRVHLSELFAGRSATELGLADANWYAEHGIALRLAERVDGIDAARHRVRTARGRLIRYDLLVLATGSAPFVPAIPGVEKCGVFAYRTIEDVDAIRAWAARARRAVVIGGGLLGLEAAKAARDLGLDTQVVEFAPRLMPRQVDAGGGEVLRRAIEALGVRSHLGAATEAIVGNGSVTGVQLAGGIVLGADLVIISAGIRPRDELARRAGLAVGDRGGIAVDSGLRTSDPHIYAIGECALAGGMIYGLAGPGFAMADTLAARLHGDACEFTGADLSTKLKLLGIEVASFGDPFADAGDGATARPVVFEDRVRGVYQKLVISADGARLLGGILVGDASPYGSLVQTVRERRAVPERPHELLFGGGAAPEHAAGDPLICSCNGISAAAIRAAIGGQGLTSVGGVKACTKAGTGCGGCVPTIARILEEELMRAGRPVDRHLCEHFAYTRQELFEIVKLGRIGSFDQLIASHGHGSGCEICRPAVASILASTWNDFVLNHATIQDTNDRFLANIQRGGTYSVVPRVPGGEITPEKLITLGSIARRYDLYCKITGGQRIDLLGARVEQLPDIWEDLVNAGFESGHAYGKAVRTVKSCVGTTWCRFGVQDSVALAIRLEERYRGIRAPHKLKSAVSGCLRECAEAQSKDFGVIATERGWNLYVCGNGGTQPRHADLLAADVEEPTLIRLIDRFLMYYIHTAKPLERTARWLERLDGAVAYLRRVIVDDALGICAQLERDMQQLVASYECEWAAVVRDPEKRAQFRHFADRAGADPSLEFVRERGQRRPADWPDPRPLPIRPQPEEVEWVRVVRADQVPHDGGVTVLHGDLQIAVFHFASRGQWYATQAMCPHRKDMVLARGLLGSQEGEPKVACPLHKKTFSLESGAGLSDPQYRAQVFPVKVEDGEVYVELPAADSLLPLRSCAGAAGCTALHA